MNFHWSNENDKPGGRQGEVRAKPKRTDFGRRFLAAGNWHRGRVTPLPALHQCSPRQVWMGRELPCADPRCPWSNRDPYLYMAYLPPAEKLFADWNDEPMATVPVEKAEFRRVVWSDGWRRWFTWEQTRGPDESKKWCPRLPPALEHEREMQRRYFESKWGPGSCEQYLEFG